MLNLTREDSFVNRIKAAQGARFRQAKGILLNQRLRLIKSAVSNSQLLANSPAAGGKIKLTAIRLNPHKVIRVASGTMNKFAKTVMGENILK